jgi:membrane-associated protein
MWFHKRHLERAHEFYARHGGKALVLARFMPIVRTFAPIVAGMARMDYGRFVLYTLIGAVVWAIGLTWLGYAFGYYVGQVIDIDRVLLPVVGAIILISIAPTVIHLWRERSKSKATLTRA